VKNTIFFIFILIISFANFGCSPFDNYSLIETVRNQVPYLFSNAPTPVRSSPTGGQIVSNGAGYRMNVAVGPLAARTRSCNAERCVEIGISK
jgi:hypothetical protein